MGESDEEEEISRPARKATPPRNEDKKKEKDKQKKRKYSSSEESSEGGYYQAPASKAKPIIRENGDPLSKPTNKESTKTEIKKAPVKEEPKRVFVDDDDSDDGLGRWNA